MYGTSAPTTIPIAGVQVLGGRKAPRMFHEPPKHESDAVKAAKQASSWATIESSKLIPMIRLHCKNA